MYPKVALLLHQAKVQLANALGANLLAFHDCFGVFAFAFAGFAAVPVVCGSRQLEVRDSSDG
jgi:hypothetical protein